MNPKSLAFAISLVLTLNIESGVLAQSREAYIRAGQKCLENSDPNGALSHFRSALDFEEDGRLFLLLGLAEKTAFNYTEARKWLERALAEDTEPAIKRKTRIELADLYKRTGDFTAAGNLFTALQLQDTLFSGIADSLLNYFSSSEKLLNSPLPLEASALGQDINSAESDFAPCAIGDSILIYSSLRYTYPEKGRLVPASRLAQFKQNQRNKNQKSELLPATINQPPFHNANASVSPDGKLMIFTRCTGDEENRMVCELYESQNRNGKWANPVRLEDGLNISGVTSTQPCISTLRSEGYILFFSSDRPGGFGGLDIWYSKRINGQYTAPENAGARFNSPADEKTPFYDAENDSLYISADRAEGFGGLDILAGAFSRDSGRCSPLPPPVNSGYNDLYYTRGYGASGARYLVSNRPPAKSIQGSYCCYDIFTLKDAPPVSDSLYLMKADSAISMTGLIKEGGRSGDIDFRQLDPNSPESIKKAVQPLFPIRIYFDNDQPDPRSTSPLTSRKIDDLLLDYLNRSETYLDKQADESGRKGISAFFEDSVSENYEKLSVFASNLHLLLIGGDIRIMLKVKGTASPLAESSYNVTLSQRRIESLKNYLVSWNEGKLREAIMQNRLKIDFVPVGESISAPGVSDDYNNPSRSVFSREAALERRIEIIDIILNP